MAAGVNLSDVRIEETLKIRIGKVHSSIESIHELLDINRVILQGKRKTCNQEKNRDIYETATVLWHSIKNKYLGPRQWRKVCGEFL